MNKRTGNCDQCLSVNVPIVKLLPSSGRSCVPCNRKRLDKEKEKKVQFGYKNHTAFLRSSAGPKSFLQKRVKELDRVHALFIRTRDIDDKGKAPCITCSISYHYDDLQCGHCFERGNFAIRWSVVNCNPQCYFCNVVKGGLIETHKVKIIQRYGQAAFDELVTLEHKVEKLDRLDIEDQIIKFTNLLNQNLSK